MTSKKIPAFTIMELTIAMLLSALVSGITYAAYQIISKSYLDYNHKNIDIATLLRVDELIQKDFIQSGRITWTNTQMVFKDSLNLTKYLFTPDYIIRYSTITDTFKIKGAAIALFFENRPIEGEFVDDDEQPLVDAIRLSLPFKRDTVRYFYTKNYSSQNLIRSTANAIN